MNYLIELEDFPCYFVGVDGIYSEKSGYMKKLKGGINSHGYYVVCLSKDGKAYKKKVHRLITKTFIPNPHNLPNIDHINRIKTDNRIKNLRWVTNKDNGRNSGMNTNNTSGNQGVCFHKTKKLWLACWTNDEGKQKQRSFSIKKHGDNAKQLAIDFRKKMVDETYNRPK